MRGAGGVSEGGEIGGFGEENACDFGAVAAGGLIGFVALGEGAVGKDDGFQEVIARADRADFGEVGTDLTAGVGDLMADRAGEVEDFAARGGVAVLEEGF